MTSYLFFALAAGLGPAILVYAVAHVDDPVEQARGHPVPADTLVDLMAVWAVGFGLALVIGLLPFMAMRWLAARWRLSAAVPYIVLGGLGMSLWGAVVGCAVALAPHGSMVSGASMIGITTAMAAIPGGVGGLSYWLYARKLPPIASWRAAA